MKSKKRETKNGEKDTNGEKKSEEAYSPRIAYAAMSFIAFMLGVCVLMILIFKSKYIIPQDITSKVFYAILIALGISSAAFLFGAMRSYAIYQGKMLGGVLELGGPVVLFCLVIIGGFKLTNDTTTFDLTIYLHGTKGIHDLILRNHGEIIVDFGRDRRKEKIRENGDIYFKGIPSKFRNKEILIIVDAEGFEVAIPNKRYIISGESIYVEVRQSDSLFSGTVIDTNLNPIEGVNVNIGNIMKMTDKNGTFRINIPSEIKKKQMLFVAKKPGYRTESGFIYTDSKKEVEIILSEK